MSRSKIVLFGAGAIGQVTTPTILKQMNLLDNVECYIDNDSSRWGSSITVYGKTFSVKSPEFLNECDENTVIFLNISRYQEVLNQLDAMECTKNMECYIIPMMCIHNFCLNKSEGTPALSKHPLIPKKIHYMWLGRKPIPENLQKCIDSWRRFCPDYEIVQWNEDNYDLDKHPYLRQAYDAKAFGFVPDYARLDILYNEGGIYLDTDVEIVRNIDALLYQEAFCGVEKWQIVNFGGMSGSVPGHPMIKKFLDSRREVYFVDENGKQNRNTCGFYDTPVILNSGYVMNGTTQNISGMNVYAYDYFHPYDYMSGSCNITENTYSIHRFNGGWMDGKMKEQNRITAQKYGELYEKCIIR